MVPSDKMTVSLPTVKQLAIEKACSSVLEKPRPIRVVSSTLKLLVASFPRVPVPKAPLPVLQMPRTW